jgi:hypothetical protein
VFCCALLYGWCSQAAEPSVAIYYGAKASLSELSLYDIAVVEPDHGYDPQRLRDQAPGSELYAYASVAGAAGARLLRKLPAAWKMARNGAWRSIVIDQTPRSGRFFARGDRTALGKGLSRLFPGYAGLLPPGRAISTKGAAGWPGPRHRDLHSAFPASS